MVAASSATVEVEVAEKKEDETGLQERERGSRGGCLVVVPASYGGAGIFGGV